MRYFVGISLPREVKKELVRIQEHLKKDRIFTGTFVPPENLHITLLFFGHQSDEQLAALQAALKTLLIIPFEAQLATLEAPHKKPRLIWVNIFAPQLAQLYQRMVTLLPEFKEEREFHGHCTIARVKQVANRDDFHTTVSAIDVAPLIWHVDSITLYSSVTLQEGPVYTEILSYR